MKTFLWALVLYESAVGISELLWPATGSTILAAVAGNVPSAASLIDPIVGQSNKANFYEGGLDLSVALVLWAVFLR